MKKLMLPMLLMLGLTVLADDMPFWGDEPNLERDPSDEKTEFIPSFSSWTVFVWSKTLQEFSSEKTGLLLFFK